MGNSQPTIPSFNQTYNPPYTPIPIPIPANSRGIPENNQPGTRGIPDQTTNDPLNPVTQYTPFNQPDSIPYYTTTPASNIPRENPWTDPRNPLYGDDRNTGLFPRFPPDDVNATNQQRGILEIPLEEPWNNEPFKPPIVDDPKLNLSSTFPYNIPPGPGASEGITRNVLPDAAVPPVISPNPPDDPPDPGPVPREPPPTTECPSYHPDATVPGRMSQADTVRAITAYVNSKGQRHDPDGITWMKPGDWTPWDGVTTINPCTSTTQQIMAFVFPKPGGGSNINSMRGIRELFYSVKPFKDNQNPTVAEIENWNIEVIRLFRRLLGKNFPVENHKCTYLKAAWADERAHTDYWTANYPGQLDSATGPCTLPTSSNAHCGASFIPNANDQIPYLCPSNLPPCGEMSGAEGVSNHNTDIPWSIKMSRIIGQYLNSDGIGAHTGPFIGRPYFGSAWYIYPNNPGTVAVRTKWSGPLQPTCP